MAEREITEAQALARLKGLVKYNYKVKDLAADADVSAAYASRVFSGLTPPSGKILALAGVTKRVAYFVDDEKKS